jgi:hypothetical protein
MEAVMAVFEQSNKSVRIGSQVLFCYDGGDVDVVEVTYASPMTHLVEVKFPDGGVKSVTSAALAPYEDQDFDEADRAYWADI